MLLAAFRSRVLPHYRLSMLHIQHHMSGEPRQHVISRCSCSSAQLNSGAAWTLIAMTCVSHRAPTANFGRHAKVQSSKQTEKDTTTAGDRLDSQHVAPPVHSPPIPFQHNLLKPHKKHFQRAQKAVATRSRALFDSGCFIW